MVFKRYPENDLGFAPKIQNSLKVLSLTLATTIGFVGCQRPTGKPIATALSTPPPAVVQTAAAQDVLACKMKWSEAPQVKGRSATVKFPDGRKITVVGHVHGEREFFKLLALANQQKLETLADGEYNDLLIKILEKAKATTSRDITIEGRKKLLTQFNSTSRLDFKKLIDVDLGYDITDPSALLHAGQDYEFLSSLLDKKEVQVVGIEGTPAVTAQILEQIPPAYLSVKLNYESRVKAGRTQIQKSDFDDLIKTSMNGHLYYFVTQNEQVKSQSVRFIGIEDPEATQKAREAEGSKEIDAAMQRLIDLDSSYWANKAESERRAYLAEPNNWVYNVTLKEIFDEVAFMLLPTEELYQKKFELLKSSSPEWMQPGIQQLINAFQTKIKFQLQRDVKSAQQLVAQKANVVHFVGLLHFKTILANLEKECVSESQLKK